MPTVYTRSSLRGRLMLWLIPPVILILLLTGYVMYLTANNFIEIALQRNSKLQVMAMRHEVDTLLKRCLQDLRFYANAALEPTGMRDYLARRIAITGIDYRDFAYISQSDSQHSYWVAQNGLVASIPPDRITEIRPNPLLYYEKIRDLAVGQVWISSITEVEHPFPAPDNPNRKIQSRVIYFVMPYGPNGGPRTGFLILSIDARQLRNILSLYNSSKSPLWAFPRTPEVRYSFVFDTAGWILMQSEEPEKTGAELGTDQARATYSGTLGRPDLPAAFRPASVYGDFWKMVSDVREGKLGIRKVEDRVHHTGQLDTHYLAYAPLQFEPGYGQEPLIYGGIAYVDRSRLTLAAGYKQIDIMFLITVATVLIVSMLIYFVGRAMNRPILRLARAVSALQTEGKLHPLDFSTRNYEAGLLADAVNKLIETVNRQMEEIAIRDRKIQSAGMQEKAPLDEALAAVNTLTEGQSVPAIVGFGSKVDRLRSDIIKAARVDVDVLIIGETGTGKQLAAEAIHQLSPRRDQPFISINCGELDENLLLDTLFGHVKGAFTEARNDRKGAFLEANGGTLFLDEIQSASPAVQQSLLRAISMRKIKPLGSDRELDVDVRLIAATNANLAERIDQNRFRSDLYFRLKVITIHTPPLREQRENIPVLTGHFLQEMERLTHRQDLGLTKGALERLKHYDWPGNIRELKNCLTRAVVMAEGNLIHAEDILLECDMLPSEGLDTEADIDQTRFEGGMPAVDSGASYAAKSPWTALNERQQKAMPTILQKGGVTRREYQKMFDGGMSSRTALYDLKDLVEKGFLQKMGLGPATRYVPRK